MDQNPLFGLDYYDFQENIELIVSLLEIQYIDHLCQLSDLPKFHPRETTPKATTFDQAFHHDLPSDQIHNHHHDNNHQKSFSIHQQHDMTYVLQNDCYHISINLFLYHQLAMF